MTTFTTFFTTSSPLKESKRFEMVIRNKEAMDWEERELKKEWIDIKTELEFRIDELETQLMSTMNEKKQKERQINDQLKTIQHLRAFRDNSVEITEYQVLNERFDKLSTDCEDKQNKNDLMSKRLKSNSEEIESLYTQLDSKTQELDKCKTTLTQSLRRIEQQNKDLIESNVLKQKCDELAKHLDTERAENLRLNELWNGLREEQLKHNESNISVDDFNQSLNRSKLYNSFTHNSIGESMDCVVNIKLAEVEAALEDKQRECESLQALNEELNQRVIDYKTLSEERNVKLIAFSETNEELGHQMKTLKEVTERQINDFKDICIELESKVEQMSADCHSLRDEVEGQKQKNENLIKDNQTLESMKESLTNEMKENKQKYDKTIEELIHSNEDIKREKELLGTALNNEKKNVLKVSEEFQELQTLKEETERQSNDWEVMCIELEAKVEQMSSECHSSKAEIMAQKQRNENLIKDNQILESIKESLTNEMKENKQKSDKTIEELIDSNEDIKREKELLGTALNNEKKNVLKVSKEFLELQTLKEETERQINDLDVKCSELESKVNQMSIECHVLNVEIEGQKQKNENLVKDNQTLETIKESLTNDMKENKQKSDKTIEDLIHSNEDIKREKELLGTALKNEKKNVLKVSEEFQELQTLKEEAERQINEWKGVCNDLNLKVEQMTGDFKTNLEDKERINESILALNEELNQRVIDCENNLKEKNEKLITICETNKELENKIQFLKEDTESQVNRWKGICDDLNSSAEQMTIDFKTTLADKQQEIDSIQALNEELNQRVIVYKTLSEERNEKLIAFLETNEELENQMKTLKEMTERQINDLEVKCSELESKVNQMSIECHVLNVEIDGKKERIKNLVKDNQTLKTIKESLTNDMKEKTQKSDKTIEELIHSNEDIKREKELLGTALKNEKKNVLKVSEEIQELQTLKEETERQFNDLKDICIELESKVEQMSADCHSLRDEVEGQKQKNENLIKDNQTLESIKESLTNEMKEKTQKSDKTIEELIHSNEDIKREKECLGTALNNEKRNVLRVSEEFQELLTLKEETEKQINEWKGVCNDLNLKVEQMTCDFKTNLEDKQRINESILALNEELNQRVIDCENHLKERNEKLITISETNKTLGNQIQSIKDDTERQVNDWKGICDDLNSTLKQMTIDFKTTLADKQQESDSIVALNQELSQRLIDSENTFAETRQQLNSISEMNNQLNNKMQTLNEETESQVNQWKAICTELESKVEQMSIDCHFLTDEIEGQKQRNERLIKDNQTLESIKESLTNDLKENKQKSDKTIEELIHSNEDIKREKELLGTALKNEKKNGLKASEELQEMQRLFDLKFENYRQKIINLSQNVSEGQQKYESVERELKNQKSVETDHMNRISKEYEKLISDLKTKLNTEEMSFDFERKIKERYAKDNELLSRKVDLLQKENKRLNDLLSKPPMTTSVIHFPTTFNINTTQPMPNQTNFEMTSMDISNQNASNGSLNISRRPPIGMGSRFSMADEEGEFMDPNHLNALKRGECHVSDSVLDDQRMSILQRRNTMVLPHLKSAYALELPFMKEDVSPDDIKYGFDGNESKTLKQIQNLSHSRNDLITNRKNASISCDNISIHNSIANKTQTHNKRGDIENIKTMSKMSLKAITPTKMFRKVMKSKNSWTPSKQ